MSEHIWHDGGTEFPAAHDRSTTAGMSLRAYLIGQAISNALSCDAPPETIAKAACSIADAVIKELNK